MTAKQATQLISSMKAAKETIAKMTPAEKNNLEKSWEIEHAYYSSTLEGNEIDRKEFEEIAKEVK